MVQLTDASEPREQETAVGTHLSKSKSLNCMLWDSMVAGAARKSWLVHTYSFFLAGLKPIHGTGEKQLVSSSGSVASVQS